MFTATVMSQALHKHTLRVFRWLIPKFDRSWEVSIDAGRASVGMLVRNPKHCPGGPVTHEATIAEISKCEGAPSLHDKSHPTQPVRCVPSEIENSDKLIIREANIRLTCDLRLENPVNSWLVSALCLYHFIHFYSFLSSALSVSPAVTASPPHCQ